MDFFIHSTGFDSWAACIPKIGRNTKLWANCYNKVDFEKIVTGREMLIIDFPQRILIPIFLIINEMTFPYRQIVSASVNIKHSLGSYINPLFLKLSSHSSIVYFSPIIEPD